MRITLDGIDVERARLIYEWMEDERASFFYKQLLNTEKILFEQWVLDPSNPEYSYKIKALRSIIGYHDILLDFLRQSVDAQKLEIN